MNNPISIARPEDAAKLNKLVNSAYRGDTSRQGWTTEADLLDGTRIDEHALLDLLKKADTTILKYEAADEITGCVELRKEGDTLYLGMLSVKPDTQGQGIGKKLLAAAEVFAQQKRISKIFMTVISVREELIQWYIRHGYRLTGERKPFVVPDTRWGIPKQTLEFVVLEKSIPIRFDIRYLRPGQKIKVIQEFKDFDNDVIKLNSEWTFERYTYFPYDGGYTFFFKEGMIRLLEVDHNNTSKVYDSDQYFELVN